MKQLFLFFSTLQHTHKIVFLIGLAGVIFGAFGIRIDHEATYIRIFDNIHWTFGTAFAAILSFLGYRRNSHSSSKNISLWFFIGFTGYAIGQLTWDVQAILSYSAFPSPSDMFYLWLGPCISIALLYEVHSKTTKLNKLAFWLDLLAFSVAALTLILISYLPRKGTLDTLSMTVLVSYPITLLIPVLIVALMIPSMRLRFDSRIFLFLIGMTITSWSWMHWNSMALDGVTTDGSWFNITFSIAILLASLAVSDWNLVFSNNKNYDRICEGFLKFLPIFTVLISSAAIVLLSSNPYPNPIVRELIYFGTAIVIALSIIRQSRLLSERDELLEVQAEALKSTALLKTIVQTVPVRIFWKDRDLRYLGCNDLIARDAGFEHSDEVIGKNDFDMGWREQAELYRADDSRVIETGVATLGYEEPQTTPDGNQIWLRTSKVPLTDPSSGEIIGILGVYDDITEHKTIEQKLQYIANYDTLTDLPNRLLLSDRLHQAISQSKRRGSIVGVIYLDLDGFKEVNDRYGHDIGDQMLINISHRMKQALREGDTLSRLGGDEFVAIVQDIENTKDIEPLLDRLLLSASSLVTIGNFDFRVSASIGVTFYPQDEEVDADQLLRQSDQAMYQAKQSGKNRYHLFDPHSDRAIRSHHESLERTRIALANKEFVLYYQPKVNIRTGSVIGAEALIRWNHPKLGLLPPIAFLPDIQNHHLMADIGEWVIESAMQQIETWHNQGVHLPISVNIDNVQLQQDGFVEMVQNLLQRYPSVKDGALEFEILETSALENISLVAKTISQFQDLGINFALDDFGTGYSSLTYLKRLPVKTLKIDQSFVFDLLDEPEDLAIIEGVLELSDTFDRKVIAEGVENITIGTILLSMGCEEAQGYAIAKPMEASAILEWMESWKAPTEWTTQQIFTKNNIPIVYAIVEHRAWIKRVCDFLTHQNQKAPLVGIEQCNFGKWLHGIGSEILSDQTMHSAIVAQHKEIHRLAKILIEEHINGEMESIKDGIKQLESMRDDIAKKLLQFITSN